MTQFQANEEYDDLKTTVDMLVSGWRDVNRQLSTLRRLDAGGRQEIDDRIGKFAGDAKQDQVELRKDLTAYLDSLRDRVSCLETLPDRIRAIEARLAKFFVNEPAAHDLIPERIAHGWKLPRPDGSVYYVYDLEPPKGPRP